MIRRPRRTLPAVLVALVLLAAATLIAISCIQVQLRQPPLLLPFASLAELGAGLAWNQPLVLGVAGALTVLGLVLVAAAVVPGAPTVLPLQPVLGQPDTGAGRRSLSQALTRAAGTVDGIERARVRVGTGRVNATVTTALPDDTGLAEQVRAALSDRLDDIAPARQPVIRVRVLTARSS